DVPVELLASERVVDAVAVDGPGLVLGEPVNGSAVEGDLHLPVGTRDHAQRSCGHGAGGLTLDGQRLPELEARARALNHPPGLLVGGVQRLTAGVDEHAA